jgi:hypothetical protein
MTFQEILDELRVPYRGSGDGARHGWLDLQCPRCGHHRDGSNKFYLGYNISQNRATCWTCGAQSVLSVLVELAGRPFSEIKALAGDLARSTYVPKKTGVFKWPSGLHSNLSQHHRAYLRERFPRMMISELRKTWDLMATWQTSGPIAWRIVIPIKLNGINVSWTGRAINDANEPKYLSAAAEQEAIAHKTLLFGEDYVRTALIVTEGPLDAMAIGPGATATCGTGYSPAQIRRIAAYPIRYICFDAEPSGQRRAGELCDILAGFPGETHNVLLDSGKDAAAASRREINQLRKLLR